MTEIFLCLTKIFYCFKKLGNMKRYYKSGAQKRKEAASAAESVAKLTKLTKFFPVALSASENSTQSGQEQNSSNLSSVELNSATSNTLSVENEIIQKDQPSTSKANCTPLCVEVPERTVQLPEPSFNSLSNDPVLWPAFVSDTQRCDIVKRGPCQVNCDFPYNITTKRRFSAIYYKRTLRNGETVPRSWLIYSQGSDKVFCFCCKLFGNISSPFSIGLSTWEGISKKLKDHENGAQHKKCFGQWMLLKEGIRNQSTIDMQEMQLLFAEKKFWKSVLERLIDIVIFLAERNLAFRGSKEVLGSPHNGNFLGLFELLAKRDSVLNELQRRIMQHQTKQHYLSNTVQNELLQIIAKEAEKELLKQLTKAKYFAIMLDCTPDISHREQMSVILRYVHCDDEQAIVKEAFFGYLKVNDSSGKGLLETFLERSKDLQLNLLDCRGQCYDNGANMKGKNAGLQTRILEINPKALFVPCANHSLNLVVVDSAKSSSEAILFFGVLTQLYALCSSSTQRWSILSKHVPLTIKSPSATRWESRIKCIAPLRFHFSNVLEALEELQGYCLEKKDGKTAAETRCLITHITSWGFVLSIVIWHDILFQINKTSKLMQTYGISLEVIEKEINATQKFLEKYRDTGYNEAVICAHEMVEDLDIDCSFPQGRRGRKKRMFDYEGVDESNQMSAEVKFKTNFFFKIIDRAIASLKNRFEQTHTVAGVFDFLINQERLLSAYQENNLLTMCKNFEKKLGDIDPLEMKDELERFVHVIKANKESLKTASDFLTYICRKQLLEVYPNLFIALRVLLACPVSVAGAERSFSKLKLIKTFHRSTMMDDRLSALAMISIESACVRNLDYSKIIEEFANEKARKHLF